MRSWPERSRYTATCRTNPERFVNEYRRDGSGHGFVLQVLPHREDFALWVQFTVSPLDRIVLIARVELLGPSPAPGRTNGHPPA